jgi:hypothetical protein
VTKIATPEPCQTDDSTWQQQSPSPTDHDSSRLSMSTIDIVISLSVCISPTVYINMTAHA